MSQISIDQDNNKKVQSNNLMPLTSNKSQLYSPLDINQKQNFQKNKNKNYNQSIFNKKQLNIIN